jgi:hypothetical protein
LNLDSFRLGGTNKHGNIRKTGNRLATPSRATRQFRDTFFGVDVLAVQADPWRFGTPREKDARN